MPQIGGGGNSVTIEDTPVDGHTAEGISSNWAYDHTADAEAHHPAVDPGEGFVSINAWDYTAIISGTWLFSQDASDIAGMAAYVSSPAINDQIDYTAFLAAGTYTINMIGRHATNKGIATILIDGVSVGTMDWYDAGGQAYHEKRTITGVVVATSGIKTISVKMASKNPASSDYQIIFNPITFIRTA